MRGPRQWLEQLWSDVKASTDPSVLGALRVLGLLYGRIDRSVPIDRAWRKAMAYRLPSHVGWRHALGGITYLLFMVLVVTGVLLAFYYRPSVDEAYPSIQYISSEVPFGWLLRDLHVWSANLIVIAVLAHMARVFFAGAYKPPRETSWLVGLLLLGVVLAFGSTGYLLPWDQWAYWTTTEVLESVGSVPVLGGLMAGALMGDVFVSGATLSRFFAWHVIILPWVAFGLLSLHFVVLRKHGVAPPVGGDPGSPPPGEVTSDVDDARIRSEGATTGSVTRDEGTPFYPTHLLRSVIAAALVLAVVTSLAALYPRPVGDPATPFEVPDELVSTWVVTDVRLALLRYFGAWGTVVFLLLGIGLAIVPLFDRRPERRPRRRPIATALGLVFFVGFLVAWIAGSQIRSLPPDTGTASRILEERAVPAPPAETSADESSEPGSGADDGTTATDGEPR